MNDNIPWSTAHDADLKRMIREGRSLGAIAAVLGRSFEDVERRLKVLGNRMPGATPKDLKPP